MSASLSLTFLGAARTVTGSRYLLESSRARLLIDAGLFQERAYLARNWGDYGFDPAKLDAVLLTHGHLDHCGWLPKLVKDGFGGPVHATAATADLAPIILRDTARIQMEDARNKAKRHAKEGRAGLRPPMPLYDADDAERTIQRFRPAPGLDRPVEIAPGVTAEWGENGHILGASWVGVEADGVRVVFSGDIGRWNRPILNDPRPPERADYLLVESTYGDRLHPAADLETELAEALDDSLRRGGNLLIPSFSVERAQELLYLFSRLAAKGRLGHDGVYLDSPMASRVTELFSRHPEVCDGEMLALIRAGQSPFAFKRLEYVQTAEESKKLNGMAGGAVIIAGNGMCTGGRIKHHLARGLANPANLVLFVGYQAPGTLGRELVDGAGEVRLFNRRVSVQAGVRQIGGLSGHADRNELLRWTDGLRRPPAHCFVTHGDEGATAALAASLREKRGWNASCPSPGQRTLLEPVKNN